MKTKNHKIVRQNNRIKKRQNIRITKQKKILTWLECTNFHFFFGNLLKTKNDNMFTSPITIFSLLNKDM
jgi:hypothetical protein